MYNNKHYFSDVIAGAGIGILTTKAAYWINNKLFKNKDTHKPYPL
jgi:membrane-associated phospholipid phosphatase